MAGLVLVRAELTRMGPPEYGPRLGYERAGHHRCDSNNVAVEKPSVRELGCHGSRLASAGNGLASVSGFRWRFQQERRALVTKFPYAVVYREIQDEIEIIAIAHLKRRPKYWSSRR